MAAFALVPREVVAPPKHPATFPEPILAILRGVVPKGRVLDPFGGVGTLGRLGPEWRVTSLEIEPEWANQGYANGCAEVVVGDATCLPYPDGSWPCLATSPSYGNRASDTWLPDDYGTSSARRSHQTRRTYTLFLGRPLAGHNAGAMQWGQPYRDLHVRAMKEFYRVLAVGGLFVLNIKDHVRDGVSQGVPTWWSEAAQVLGFTLIEEREVVLKGDQNTARARKQGRVTVDYEEVLVFVKGAAR